MHIPEVVWRYDQFWSPRRLTFYDFLFFLFRPFFHFQDLLPTHVAHHPDYFYFLFHSSPILLGLLNDFFVFSFLFENFIKLVLFFKNCNHINVIISFIAEFFHPLLVLSLLYRILFRAQPLERKESFDFIDHVGLQFDLLFLLGYSIFHSLYTINFLLPESYLQLDCFLLLSC